MKYHNRTDFRAFDVMVHAIDDASPDDLQQAIYTAHEFADDPAVKASRRAIWNEFGKLLTHIKNDRS
jgi:hypothetical protein